MSLEELEVRRSKALAEIQGVDELKNSLEEKMRLLELFPMIGSTIDYPKEMEAQEIIDTFEGFRFDHTIENWAPGNEINLVTIKAMFGSAEQPVYAEMQTSLDQLEYQTYLNGERVLLEKFTDRLLVLQNKEIPEELLEKYLIETLTNEKRKMLVGLAFFFQAEIQLIEKMEVAERIKNIKAVPETKEVVNFKFVDECVGEICLFVYVIRKELHMMLQVEDKETNDKIFWKNVLYDHIQKKEAIAYPDMQVGGVVEWRFTRVSTLAANLIQTLESTKKHQIEKRFKPELKQKIKKIKENILYERLKRRKLL